MYKVYKREGSGLKGVGVEGEREREKEREKEVRLELATIRHSSFFFSLSLEEGEGERGGCIAELLRVFFELGYIDYASSKILYIGEIRVLLAGLMKAWVMRMWECFVFRRRFVRGCLGYICSGGCFACSGVRRSECVIRRRGVRLGEVFVEIWN